MRNTQRRNKGLEMGVILLCGEILRLGFNSIPPVTLLTVLGQILLYVGVVDIPWEKYDVCISGYKVWNKRDYKSLLLSTFEHGDDMHLYYNMISFLVKGRSLERKHGSANFAILLAFLCVATPVIYVALAVCGANVFHEKEMMKSCAIGFSGVIFALKLITTIEENGYSYVAGFRVAVRYSAWVELIAIHVLVPNASFMGHLAGILAGLLYMKTYVGTILDKFIYYVTGEPMRHNSSYGFRYDSSRGSSSSSRRQDNYGFYRTGNYSDDFYRNSNNYYNDGNYGGYNDYGYPDNYYRYEPRPSAPPGWNF